MFLIRRSISVGSGPVVYCCMGGLGYCLIGWALLSWRCKDLHVRMCFSLIFFSLLIKKIGRNLQ